MKITPLSNRILIEPLKKDKETASGLIIPDSASEDRPIIGVILAIGPDIKTIEVGNKVLFKKYGPDEIVVENKSYLVGDESDIIAIIEE